MDKDTNLPIEVKNSLPIEKKRNIKRTVEGIKRIGKIALNAGIAGSGLVMTTAIGGPIAGVIGTGLWCYGGFNAGYNAIINRKKDSMFVTSRNMKGEISLSQDITNYKAFEKLKDLDDRGQKSAMMGLEMFVGMQNYKQQYEDQNKKKDPARDSTYNVYRQIFKTKTHSVNIKALEILEKLGYIQIEKKEPIKKSVILIEKLGFKEYEEVKETLKAMMSRDKEEISKHQEQCYEIKFKLTDKPFDLEDVYRQYMEIRQSKEKHPQKLALRRIYSLLSLLKDKNIDIETDELGIKRINCNAKESFFRRMNREFQDKTEEKSFRESLQVQLEPEQQHIKPETEHQSAKEEQKTSHEDYER